MSGLDVLLVDDELDVVEGIADGVDFAALGLEEVYVAQTSQRAKELLLNSSDSVTEIAFSSGYNDIYYFNRVFRKAVNCSPMEFRKNRGRTGG